MSLAQAQARDAKTEAKCGLNGRHTNQASLLNGVILFNCFATANNFTHPRLLLDEENGHGAPDVVFGGGMHLSTALIIQLDTHLGLACFGIVRLLGVLHIVAGHNIATHDVLHTPLILIGLKLRLSGSRQCLQAKLQVGEFVQNFLRPGAVLYARQIDHNSRAA